MIDLMLKKTTVCNTFFDTEVDGYGSIIQEMPTLSELKTNLFSCSDVYDNDPVSGRRGIGFS